jgi:hypothetical protein
LIQRRYSRILIMVAILAAALLIYSARDELVEAISNASILLLGLLYLATLAQNVTLWLVFHASIGAGDRYLETAKMHFGGQVAKYLPGKVWGLVYQTTLKTDGMPVGHIVQGNIVLYALGIVSVVFSSLALLAYPASVSISAAVLLAGAAVSAYFMSSDHLYRIIQRFSRLSARFELSNAVPKTDFSVAARIGVYIVLILTYVLSNIFLLYAFFDVDIHQALRLTAYLGIAWLAGVVVAVSPSGLGIREAVFIGIGQISDENSFELYASIAIVARIIQVIQDLLSAFLVPGIVGLYFNRSRSA